MSNNIFASSASVDHAIEYLFPLLSQKVAEQCLFVVVEILPRSYFWYIPKRKDPKLLSLLILEAILKQPRVYQPTWTLSTKGGFSLIAEITRRQFLQYIFGAKTMAASIIWLISFEKIWLRVVFAMTKLATDRKIDHSKMQKFGL